MVLVSAERSADLRAYYAKHTKSDRLDSVLLARLPMLHPEGLHPERGLGPGDPLRRATKMHSTLVKRRTTSLARLDALLEILGPGWHAALRGDLSNKTPLKFLAAGYADPHTLKRIGRARLARFIHRHSRGAWGEPDADALLAAARATLELWGDDDLSFPDLADDIALEARLALQLTEEIKELDERISVLCPRPRPARHHHLRPRHRRGHRSRHLGQARRRQPVLLAGRGPFLQRPGPLPGRLRRLGSSRRPDQTWRRTAARSAVPQRQPGPAASTPHWPRSITG